MSEYHDDAHGECETLPPEIDKLFELWRKFCVSDNLDGVRANVLIEIRKVEDDAPDVDFDAVVRMFAGESEVDKWRVRGGREMRQAPVPEIQRQRTRWKIWQVVVALALLGAATIAVGIPFLRGRGGDLKKAERPTAKAHADSLSSPPVSRGAGVVEGEVEGVKEKVETALEAVHGPPDTLEVGGEVGTLEKLPENCFWGVLSKSKCVLALTYRMVKASDGTEVMQKFVMVFSPDCRSCFILNPKPKQPPSKQPPFSGGIYFSNDGGASFMHMPFPQTLTETTYLKTHADPELQNLLLRPALSGSKEGEYGETLDVRQFPKKFYNISPAAVSQETGTKQVMARELLEKEFAESLMVSCAAEQRKVRFVAGQQK